MTREQFLKDLKAALAGMKEEELEGVVAYYAEMIDDRVEAGMTEEAAVKAMEPVREIASRVLEEAGLKEEAPKEEKKGNWQQISRSAEDVKVVHVQAEGKRVRIVTEENSGVQLRYCIGSNDIFRLHEAEGVLTLEHKLRPISSFVNEKSGEGITLEGILAGVGKFISSLGERVISSGVFTYEAPENEIVITLPRSYFGQVQVHTSNARISVENLTAAQPIRLSTSNAFIKASNVNCAQEVVFTTSNSRIVLDDVNVSGAKLTTSNGRVELNDVFARSVLEAVTSNGAISVADTQSEERLQLTTSNGRVELDDAAAPEIVIKTSNGAVSGTVKGKREEYTVISHTSNAANQLGSREDGEKTLRVSTSNAPITLHFEE